MPRDPQMDLTPTSTPSPRRQATRVALALGAAQLAWGAWFIWRTSFELAGTRAFCLFDDAMISMVYARNVAAGHGLNWAGYGAPVEGFSHPLWTGLMSLVHLVPISALHTSLVIQLVSLCTLIANTIAIGWLTRRHFSAGATATWLPAASATAFYYPLNHWALQGMETGLQALLATLAVALTLDIAERGAPRQLLLALVLALSYLLRMDMAILAAVTALYLAARGAVRRGDRQKWLLATAVLLLPAIGYQLFRVSYFGDPLPNTYYLKLAGVPLEVRWLRGLATLVDALRPQLLLLSAIALVALHLRRAYPKYLLLLAVAGTSFLYSVHVGGDVWEKADIGANRFVAFAMPMLFVAANGMLNLALSHLPRPWGREPSAPQKSLLAAATVVAAFAMVLYTNRLYPHDQRDAWARFLVLDPPLHSTDHAEFTRQVLALQQSGAVSPDARVATMWAGIPAYFSTWQMVDILGYNDRTTAHGPPTVAISPRGYLNYQPGHVKQQHEQMLRQHRPDFIYQIWGLPREQLVKLLTTYGYDEREGFWFAKASTRTGPERLGGYKRLLASPDRLQVPRR